MVGFSDNCLHVVRNPIKEVHYEPPLYFFFGLSFLMFVFIMAVALHYGKHMYAYNRALSESLEKGALCCMSE